VVYDISYGMNEIPNNAKYGQIKNYNKVPVEYSVIFHWIQTKVVSPYSHRLHTIMYSIPPNPSKICINLLILLLVTQLLHPAKPDINLHVFKSFIVNIMADFET